MAHTAAQTTYAHIPSLWRFSGGKEVGWFLPYWGVSISDTQLSANDNGLDPDDHPDLLAHLENRGIEIRLNKYGLIDIPRAGMSSLDRQY